MKYFFRNVGIHLQTYKTSKPRKPQSKFMNSSCFAFSELVIHISTLKHTFLVLCTYVERPDLPLTPYLKGLQIIVLGHCINTRRSNVEPSCGYCMTIFLKENCSLQKGTENFVSESFCVSRHSITIRH
jgi:hypothetical protein